MSVAVNTIRIFFKIPADFVESAPRQTFLLFAHKRSVVAEPAGKVAAADKKNPAQAAGVIDHRGLF